MPGYVPARKDGCHPVDGCGDKDGYRGADFPFLAANVAYRDTGTTIFPLAQRAAASFARLVAIMARLRGPGGCHWDQEQTHSSLAKAWCTVRMRETVGYARELLGGNGILLEHNVGRFVADAEAIYSYEGTREMNTLIVGRAITGLSAFV